MGTLRDLYLRVMSAIDSAHPTVKADVDAAFAEHEAAAGTVSDAPAPDGEGA